MSQIGFVVLAHSEPEQTNRLIVALNELYSSPPIVLHHDYLQCAATFSFTSNVSVIRPRCATSWGTYSLVEATLAGLSKMYSGSGPEWCVLLSGSCYPTRRARDVIDELRSGSFDAYVQYERIDPLWIRTPFQRECVERYFTWRVGIPSVSRRITPRYLAARWSAYAMHGCQCYAGSQWFTANRKAVECVLENVDKYAWLVRHLRSRHCPDETFFQTMWLNEDAIRVSAGHKRFTRWRVGRAHPELLVSEDWDAILASGAHFARKCAPSSGLRNLCDLYLGIGQQTGLRPGDAASGVIGSFPQ